MKKHFIIVEINKKIKIPKKKGRPKLYIDESKDNKKIRLKKYMTNHLEIKDNRIKHNILVSKYRENNREICRERVRKSRRKKKEMKEEMKEEK